MNAISLLELFNHDIGTAEQLLELIEAEYQALSEHDLPGLQQILADKQPLLVTLEQHGKTRTQTLLQLGLSADRAGLQSLAGRSDQGHELLAASDRLSELLESCQAANLRNGRIIRSSQKSTANMLGILRGGETPSLYDSSGSTAKIGNKRPLSQA
ncbi:flagella synthesis protein FlgN [Phytopseudomonas dryadis]|uniref:Flagellar biosynthesis protein FlgN n=1 Tax=Phytopseudomonas dryadis TaxID=2487520 RepID=A0A4Q9R465_9GAMM|nr:MULTISPECIES: flagellar protein FlgN [Pseudomonas]TBU93925.1 flagellar biosynthesis protein FlgN [Pseudomonas dryadis]TBV07913.1 flagellar biosynthesis protein FlgN [Pseudomonas dryadis]TBV19308.1 flagellar biosynthesis protein FlgN [Pseudomonas sp. FRB 230]